MDTKKERGTPQGAPKFENNSQCSSSAARNSGIPYQRASAQFPADGYVTPRFPDYCQERQDGEVLQALYRLCGEHPFTAAELADEIRREIRAAVKGVGFTYVHDEQWPIIQYDRPIEIDPAIEKLQQDFCRNWRCAYTTASNIRRGLNRIVGLQHPCCIELRARHGTYRIAVRSHSSVVSTASDAAQVAA